MEFLITPVICGIIGYSTNWLAIKMLFFPRYEKRVLGFRIPFTPGVLPNSKGKLAHSAANTVADYLLTAESIEEAIKGSNIDGAIDKITGDFLREFLESEKSLGFYVDLVFGEGAGESFKNVLLEKSSVYLAEALKGQNPLSGKFSEEYAGMIKSYVAGLAPEMSKIAEKALEENSPLDQRLSALVKKIVNDSVGSLVGAFVYRKVYESIKENFLSYIKEPENLAALPEKAALSVDGLIIKAVEYFYQNTQNADKLSKYAVDLVERVLNCPVKDIALFIGEKNLQYLYGIISEYKTSVIEKAASAVSKNLDIRQIVEAKINELDVVQLEKIILDVSKKELNYITSMGGILGFILGFAPQFLS